MNRSRYKIAAGYLLAVLLAVAMTSAVRAGTVTGRVIDRSTGSPVSGAVVYLFPPGDSVVSNERGEFAFSKVPAGQYMIEVTHSEFEPMMLSGQEVTGDRTLSCTVQLTRRIAPPTGEVVARQEIKKSIGVLDSMADAISGRESPAVSQGLTEEWSNEPGSGKSVDRRSKPVTPVPTPPKYIPPHEYEYDEYYGLPPFDMNFQNYGTNRFVETRRDPLSTFAADVDDASYAVARQYLHDGNKPPRDAIRVEEFVNHFDYDYPAPSYSKFQVISSTMISPFDDSTTILAIGIKGREIDRRERKPLNLTFVIDVSGSMGYDNRLELVKYALRELVDQLGRNDRIGIVTYGSGARRVLEPVSASNKREILSRIESLRPGGSTNAEAGLRMGYAMAERQFVSGHNNQIILCSDGVANVGLTRAEDLMETIQDRAREGVSLHSFGVGMGNYNDVLLEKLAKQGNGKYSYINNREEAYRLMVVDFVSTVEILARDVKIQMQFDHRAVRSYRLLGYENRAVEDNRFRDNERDGGEIGAGHEVTAVYELVLNGRGRKGAVGTLALRWKDADGREISELNQPITLDNRARRDECAPTLRLALTAAKFAEKLKETRYVRDLSYAELYEYASGLAEEMPSEQTFELLDLIQSAGGLNYYHTKR